MSIEIVTPGQKGYGRLKYRLLEAPAQARWGTAWGMFDGLQEIMLDAKDRAPKDTTAMARSGFVAEPNVTGAGNVIVNSGFGGLSEDYVVRVHEDAAMPHPNGGEAFFFQNAVDAGRDALRASIRRHVKAAIKAGRRPRRVTRKVPATPWEDQP